MIYVVNFKYGTDVMEVVKSYGEVTYKCENASVIFLKTDITLVELRKGLSSHRNILTIMQQD